MPDRPSDFQPRRIRPRVSREGKILRLLVPAAALPESCFIHPLESASLYAAIAPLPPQMCCRGVLQPEHGASHPYNIRMG